MLFWRDRHKVREEDLSAYVDGELNVSALNRLEAHLESCTACRETVSELRAVRQSVKDLPRVTVPRSFVLREADVIAEPATAAGGLFGSVTPLLSGVAAIAIVAFVVLAGFDLSNGSEFSDRSTGRTSGATMSSPVDSGQLELETAADNNAIPPVGGENGDDGTDLEDEDGLGSFTVSNGEEPVEIDDGYDPELLADDDVAAGQGGLASESATVLDEGTSNTGLRIAEAIAAGIAVVAGGAALVIWWRRRTELA